MTRRRATAVLWALCIVGLVCWRPLMFLCCIAYMGLMVWDVLLMDEFQRMHPQVFPRHFRWINWVLIVLTLALAAFVGVIALVIAEHDR